MFFMLLMLLTTAFGAPLEQQFTWDLTVDGRSVGERVLKVRYLPANHGMRRLLQSWTDVNANVLGLPYRFQQRLTAHIGEGPASFHFGSRGQQNPPRNPGSPHLDRMAGQHHRGRHQQKVGLPSP